MGTNDISLVSLFLFFNNVPEFLSCVCAVSKKGVHTSIYIDHRYRRAAEKEKDWSKSSGLEHSWNG